MFGKKLLSVIGTLLIGSQLVSVVKGQCTPTFDVDSKIYSVQVPDGLECAGYYFLESGNAYSEIDELNSDNIKLYNCSNEGVCNQVTIAGYYKDNSRFYSVNYEGNTANVGTDQNDCSSAGAGKFLSNGKFCLDESRVLELNSNKRYLFKNTNKVFNSDATKEYAIVSASSSNNIVIYPISDDVYFKFDSNEIQSRIDNFCSGTILENMYQCTNGLCNKSYSPIGAGKYIVKTDSETGSKYNLYLCNDDGNDDGTNTVSCSIDEDEDDNGILYTIEKTNDEEYTYQEVGNTSGLDSIDLTKDKLYTYDCSKGKCKPTEALIRYGSGTTADTAYCDAENKCVSGTSFSISKIGILSYDNDDNKFKMTDGETSTNISSGYNYGFSGTENAFTIIKNVGDVIVAKAKYGDDIVYVMSSDNTLTDSTSYGKCLVYIKSYSSVNLVSDTATEGSLCTPPEVECELSPTASDNEHCVEGYYLKNENDKLVNTNGELGTLYHCTDISTDGSSTIVCDEVTSNDFKVGYYKNVDSINKNTIQYIKCPTLEECKAVSVTNTGCDVAGIGGLVIDGSGSTFHICIDNSDNKIELSSGNTSKRPFISIDTTYGADAFGAKTDSSYVLLDIVSDNGGVHCFKNVSDELNYRYTDDNQILIKRGDTTAENMCKYKQDSIKEFKKGDDNVYTKTN